MDKSLDAKNFTIGSLQRQYENMKKQGKCPYDSLHEYLESIVQLPASDTDIILIEREDNPYDSDRKTCTEERAVSED